jgi:hypothetical protein
MLHKATIAVVRGVVAIGVAIAALFAFSCAVVIADRIASNLGLSLHLPVFIQTVIIVWPQIVIFGPAVRVIVFWTLAGAILGLLVRPKSFVTLLAFAAASLVVLIEVLPYSLNRLGGHIRVVFP